MFNLSKIKIFLISQKELILIFESIILLKLRTYLDYQNKKLYFVLSFHIHLYVYSKCIFDLIGIDFDNVDEVTISSIFTSKFQAECGNEGFNL